jgi:hypothetical protein
LRIPYSLGLFDPKAFFDEVINHIFFDQLDGSQKIAFQQSQ